MPSFNMKAVESSQIAEVGHDSSTETLRVKFKNGGVYDYTKVGSEVYNALMAAPSVGSYFSAVIKKAPTVYPFTKVS